MWEDSSDDEVTDFELDLQKLIKKTNDETHLDFLGPGLLSAAETIQKTRNRMLKEAEKDVSLHLLLYTTANNKKLLPWWSDVLHRIAIAQHLIEYSVKKNNITLKYAKNVFPNESEQTLKHILTAVFYNVKRKSKIEQEEKSKIVHSLLAQPETYERLNTWNLNKKIYIYKCIAGFLNAFMHTTNNVTTDIKILVAVNDEEQYGYFKTGEPLIGMVNYDKLLSTRESMNWFAQEVAHVFMFDFEWEQAIQWASYVYKTLTYM